MKLLKMLPFAQGSILIIQHPRQGKKVQSELDEAKNHLEDIKAATADKPEKRKKMKIISNLKHLQKSQTKKLFIEGQRIFHIICREEMI